MAGPPKTYEEANWAQLSPAFRAEHNRLRKAKGLRPIPPPKVDRYVPPQATDLRVPSADDEEAAMEELGSPDVFLRDGCEEVRVWVGLNEEAHERLRVGKNCLALRDAQGQLQDRELKTKVLHTTIVSAAALFLDKVPEAKHTMPNAVATIMRAFGAKKELKLQPDNSTRYVWDCEEVSDKTVRNILKKAEAEAQIVIDWLMFLFLLQSQTMLDMRAPVVRMANNPAPRTPEQERECLLENIRIADDSDNTAASNLLHSRLWRADRLLKK